MPILGGQIVVIATATRPGIAAFDATNFSITSGVVDTIQDIDTTATPEFDGLHVGPYDQMTLNGAAIDSHVAINKDEPTIVEIHAHTASGPGILYWARSRGDADTPAIVQDTDELFNLSAVGYDGTDYAVGGWMKFAVDGTPGSNDMPSSWQLSLSADGSQTPTERIKIRANGAVEFSGDAGSSGEVLASAGTGGPPVWTDPTTLETDPVFTASAAAGIDGTDISNWDTAFGWGNHASAGYLTTVDISANTNLAVTAPIVLTGDTLSISDASTSSKGAASFDATDFAVSSGNVTLQAERIQDLVGAMVSGNTETGITVTYQDSDGTIDFAVATPSLVTVANEASDGSCYPLFATATTGDLQPKTNTGLIFNSTTGSLYAAAMTIGSLTGVLKGATGVVSAGTVDISSDTNLAVTAPIVLTGDTLSLNQAATYAWTGAHTWGVDGTGVDLIAYGENSGDRVHWDQDGGSGSAGRLKLFGASEFIVIGKSALGASGAIGGTAGKAVLHISETITPANFTTPAALEFSAYMAANTFGGIVGLLATAGTTAAAHNTETLAVPLDLMLDLNHTSGTVVQANGMRISGDISGGGNTTAVAAIQIDQIAGSGGTVTTCYAMLLKNQNRGSTNWQIYSEGSGHSRFGDDAARTYWGTANDAYIAFDGSNLVATVAAVTSSAQFVLADCGIVVNEGGGDKDTRIEGDTLTHMLFLDASAATENIALLAGSAPNWQAMDGGLFIANASTVPTGDPSGGGFLYVEGGALKYRGSSGTITTLGAA